MGRMAALRAASLAAAAAAALAAGWLIGWPAGWAQQQPSAWTVASAGDAGGECDGGRCTLRQALESAILSPGADRIGFDLPAGERVIRPESELPALVDEGIEIDGRTQPGWSAGVPPAVHLDGTGAGDSAGIVILAADATVRGLSIGGFERHGIAVLGAGASGARIEGNWTGMTADGLRASPNRLGGIAVLGGAADAQVAGNRVAGNSWAGVNGRTGHGVVVGGSGSTGAEVRGNVIGLGADGAALANDDGVLIVDQADAQVLGNLIAGSAVAGVEVRETAALTTVAGNWIGLNLRGVPAGNDVGVFIGRSAGEARVDAGNVIAGNRVGVAVEQGARMTVVEGNWIGLRPALGAGGLWRAEAPPALEFAGAFGQPNRERGVSVVAGANTVRVWGNWILAGSAGIAVRDSATAYVSILRNRIAGARGWTTEYGIDARDATELVIGGERRAGFGNAVAGAQWGIALRNVSGLPDDPVDALQGGTRAVVAGNRIGPGAADALPFPPGTANLATGTGILLDEGARGVNVQENEVIGASGAGIAVRGATATGNLLLHNGFARNGGPDIDLGADGETPNDEGDEDRGPNGLLNAPTITEFAPAPDDGTGYRVRGTATPGTQVSMYEPGPPRAEPFAEAVAGLDGRWEGFAASRPAGALRALAVDANGDTSEFSAAFALPRTAELGTGANLIAWLSADAPLERALGPILEAVDTVYRWDPSGRWEYWSPLAPESLASFSSARRGDALHVQLIAAASLELAQTSTGGTVEARLEPGLNLTAWGGGPTTASAALGGLERQAPGAVREAWRWDGEGWSDLGSPGQWSAEEEIGGDVLAIEMTRAATWRQAR